MLRDIEKVLTTAREKLKREVNRSGPQQAEERQDDSDPRDLLCLLAETAYLHRNSAICKIFNEAIDDSNMQEKEKMIIRKKVGDDYLTEFICSMHLVQQEEELKLLQDVFKTAAANLTEKTRTWLTKQSAHVAQNSEQANAIHERLNALGQANKSDDMMMLPAYHVALRGLYATRLEYLRELMRHVKTTEQFCQRMRQIPYLRERDFVLFKFEFQRLSGNDKLDIVLCDMYVLANVTTQLIKGTHTMVNVLNQYRDSSTTDQLVNSWFEGCIEPLFTIAQSVLDTVENDWRAICTYFGLTPDEQKRYLTIKDFCSNALRNMRVLGLFRNEVWSKCARFPVEAGRAHLCKMTSLSDFWNKFSAKDMLNRKSLFTDIEKYLLNNIFMHEQATQIFGKCEKCKNSYGPSGVCVSVICNKAKHQFSVCPSCFNSDNKVDCPNANCEGIATFVFETLAPTEKDNYKQKLSIYHTLVQATGHFLVRFIALNLPTSYSAIDKQAHRIALGDSNPLVDKLLSFAVVAPLSIRRTGAVNKLAVLTKPIRQYEFGSDRSMQHVEFSMLQTFILRRLTELARFDGSVAQQYDAVLSSYVTDFIASSQFKNAQQLCSTCIACYEDLEYLDMTKATESYDFSKRVDEMRRRLYKWFNDFDSIDPSKVLSVLQAIAGVRFMVQELVDIVHTFVDLVTGKFTEQLTDEASEYLLSYIPRLPNDLGALFYMEMKIGDRTFKIDTFYRYFVRLYVRKFGLNSFRTLSSVKEFEFIFSTLSTILPSLTASGARVLQKLVDMDFFMLYGVNFFKIRSQWLPWFTESKTPLVIDKPFDATDDRALFTSLAFVRLATRMDRELPSMDELNRFLLNHVNASTAQFVARLAISVKSVVKLTKGELPHWRYLVDLLTHWAVCLHWARTTNNDKQKFDALIGPVYQLVVSPHLYADSYLPGMPSDDLFVVRKKLHEQRKLESADGIAKAAQSQDDTIYICPSGHANVASGVDTSLFSKLCRECGLPISGTNYNLYEGSRQIRLDQEELKLPGHILGLPDKRPLEPIPQRQLSPVSVCVLRLITHLSLLASSFNLPLDNMHQEADAATSIIMHLVRLPQQSNARLNSCDDLWKFLLHHVNIDLQVLMRALHCDNLDEVCLFLHRVLKHVPELVRTSTYSMEQSGYKIDTWKQRESRDKWENQFVNHAVVPQLREWQSPLVVTTEASNEAERQQFSILQYIYSDRLLPAENSGTQQSSATHTGSSDSIFVQLLQADSVWQLRQRVSIINVERKLADERNRSGSVEAGEASFELTGMFLSNHRVYAQLQKLPDLLELYRELLPIVNRRLSLADAKRTRMDSYLKGLSEQQRNVIAPKVDVYISAWNTLRDRLLQYSFNGFRLQDMGNGVQLTPASTVDHFLPAFHGRGLCATLLITLLIEQHNILIEKATRVAQIRREKANLNQQTAAASTAWSISLRDLNRAHTVVFNGEHDLLEVLSLNATYDTNETQVNLMQYDFANVEAYIEDTWLSNKPLIDYRSADKSYVDDDNDFLPTVVFSEDVTMSLNFAKLRNKIKQDSLPSAVLETIYSREFELPHLNEMIRDLETAISLLASSGADAGENLAYVMKTQLGIQKPLAQNELVQQQCCVRHVEQLWYALSYRRTIELKRSRHDPFAYVDERLKSELPDQMRIELNNQVFGSIHVSFLMEAVYVAVIIRQPFQQASSSQSSYLDQPLSAVLRNHLRSAIADDQATEEDIIGKIDKLYGLHRLPQNIKVRHSVDLFNTAFKYSETTTF